MPLPAGVRGILIDVEGTTTPVSFVYEVLFPYAAERLEEACARAAEEPAIAAAVALLRQEHEAERQAGGGDGLPPFGDGAPYARHLMARDRKSTGLKALQGLIWEEGYRSGRLRGQVFADVPPALAAWRGAGLRLRVFSSGSVLAQRLLFGYSDHGDLTGCFEGYHDTTTGAKREATSYAAIAGAFALPPPAILFLSDLPAELDAAGAAGLLTGLFRRPGNAPLPGPPEHPVYGSFAELLP
jgi:enolase-phosphatase E1